MARKQIEAVCKQYVLSHYLYITLYIGKSLVNITFGGLFG